MFEAIDRLMIAAGRWVGSAFIAGLAGYAASVYVTPDALDFVGSSSSQPGRKHTASGR